MRSDSSVIVTHIFALLLVAAPPICESLNIIKMSVYDDNNLSVPVISSRRLNDISHDVLIEILGLLRPSEVTTFFQCNKPFANLRKDETLWASLCRAWYSCHSKESDGIGI